MSSEWPGRWISGESEELRHWLLAQEDNHFAGWLDATVENEAERAALARSLAPRAIEWIGQTEKGRSRLEAALQPEQVPLLRYAAYVHLRYALELVTCLERLFAGGKPRDVAAALARECDHVRRLGHPSLYPSSFRMECPFPDAFDAWVKSLPGGKADG